MGWLIALVFLVLFLGSSGPRPVDPKVARESQDPRLWCFTDKVTAKMKNEVCTTTNWQKRSDKLKS